MTPPVPPRSPLTWTIVAAIVSTLALPHISYAAWPHSPGINVPICTATGDQQGPSIVLDGAGGAIIAWRDLRTDGGDIYAQRVRASGAVDPAWPANGRALCTAANTQQSTAIVSDGAGGAIVTWEDFRNASDFDIYAQHVLASGAVDPAWPANGRLICGAAQSQVNATTIVSDGAGGAIISWQDFRNATDNDIYAQHVLASGAVDPAWPVNGRAICTAPGTGQFVPTLVSDGAGGAIVTWYDERGGNPAFDIYAQHVLASGAVDGAWPANGRAICNAGGDQSDHSIIADGAGGAIITWHDGRSAVDYDIYAQHVLATGFVDPAWPFNGRALCTAGDNQLYPTIVSDDAGGAIVTWQDVRTVTSWDIYAQHVLASGAVDGAWPANGRALCTASSDQIRPKIVSDGAGGAIVTWVDGRNPANNVFAQHVFASGTLDTAWPTNGQAVCLAGGGQLNAVAVPDAAGGVIVAWQDVRSNGVAIDIYAQRITINGYLGNPEPGIAGVRDVPNDNGGEVKLSWTASYLDTEQPYLVDHYWIFRNAPPDFAEQALAGGARLLAPGDPEPLSGEQAFFVAPPTVSATYYWEYIASSPAAHFTSNYSYVASTTSDSMGAGNPKTAFLVVAYNAANTVFFTSNPDSGYSVDNVPPVAPGPLAATYQGGATVLTWSANPEADVEGYRLYRGGSAGFVPGAGNLIASPSGTDYADPGPAGSYYKLSAMDRHGNESPYALVAPSGTVGVSGGSLPVELALGRPSPNPAVALATVRLALPRASSVKLSVHDMAGRQVRELYAGAMAAGERDVAWDLRDASGARVGDGLYFVRLAVEGRTIARRVAVVH